MRALPAAKGRVLVVFGVSDMAGNTADRALAERGKQTTKTKEDNARRKGKGEEGKHPAVPPGLEKPARRSPRH